MLDAWLDLAHGGRCVCCLVPGRALCAACARGLPRGPVPVRPDPVPPGWAAAYAAGWYSEPLRPLLLAHKEHRVFSLARPLGSLLAAVVSGALGEVQGARVLLVPVPSRPGVVRARGHDPVRRMVAAATPVLRAHGYDAAPVRLLRQRNAVADQAGLDVEQRAANLAGSLAVDSRGHRRLARTGRPTLVVVCDDVITTGATAREAQRALVDVGIQVAAIVAVAATRKRVPKVPVPAQSA